MNPQDILETLKDTGKKSRDATIVLDQIVDLLHDFDPVSVTLVADVLSAAGRRGMIMRGMSLMQVRSLESTAPEIDDSAVAVVAETLFARKEKR